MTQITLPNGKIVTKVDPDKNKNALILKSNTKLQVEEAKIRRKIDDLPIQNGKMNTISVVLSYYLFGLSVHDISILLKLPEEQISSIIMLPAFDEMLNAVTKSIIENDTDDVRNYIAAQTKKAAKKVVDIMETASPKYALEAAKDLLDRGGHRPIDVIEHRNKMDGELRIVHIKKDETAINNIQEAEFEEIK